MSDTSTTLFDTTGATSLGAVPLTLPAGQSFTTLGSAFTLTDVKVGLSDLNPLDETSINVTLLTSVSGAPGVAIASLATILSNTLTATSAIYDMPISQTIVLAADTQYWIKLTGDTGCLASWTSEIGTAGIGVAGQNVDIAGLVSSDGLLLGAAGVQPTEVTGPQDMEVSGTQTACFAAGTRIATDRGGVPVEQLREGDTIVTLRDQACQTVKWIGTRRVDCRKHPRPADVWPIRISPGAFGPGLPRRELELSPDHSVYVSDGPCFSKGALIPIRLLVNGATIVQHPVDVISYFHVELDRHDVLLAEGLPAETYLDTGNRNTFANGGGGVMEDADFALAVWAREACAELVRSGPRLLAARARLKLVAQSLGHIETGAHDMHLMVDGVRLDGVRRGATTLYRLPHGAASVWLASRSSVPAETNEGADDTRRLGVAVRGITVDGHPLPLVTGRGWHAPEQHWTWSDGAGAISVAGACVIEVTLAMSGRYWVLDTAPRFLTSTTAADTRELIAA